MYRQIIILFLLYIGSATTSHIFGNYNSDIGRYTVVNLIGEDVAEEATIRTLHSNYDDFNSRRNHLFGAAFNYNQLNSLKIKKLFFDLGIELNHRLLQRPLFLLFHAFLFYEIV